MNRRDFLKALATVPAAAVVPALPVTPNAVLAAEARLAEILFPPDDLNWGGAMRYAVVHPAQWFDIRLMVAREKWRDEYRTWRERRRDFGRAAPETLEQMMARVKSSLESVDVMDMREGLTHAVTYGLVGYHSDVRFIVSDKVGA